MPFKDKEKNRILEIWETARITTDPLIEKWKEYIEKSAERTRI